MTKYAYFDSAATQPTPVIGWLDTDQVNYANIPSAANLLAITDVNVWNGRMNLPMFVNGGALTTVGPPVSLLSAQTKRLAMLNDACQTAIVSGYQSNALGSVYTYPSTPTDQANMQASVVASLLPNLPQSWTTPFWCEDSNQIWAMVQHTASQIQQAGADGKIFIVNAQLRLINLIGQVDISTTIAQVLAVTW